MRETNGRFEPAGTAIVELANCWITKFGYPNDEAWTKIPRTRGLSYGLYEVMDSAWAAEVEQLNRYTDPHAVLRPERHFLFLFHDSTFECLARDWTLQMSNDRAADIAARLTNRIMSE